MSKIPNFQKQDYVKIIGFLLTFTSITWAFTLIEITFFKWILLSIIMLGIGCFFLLGKAGPKIHEISLPIVNLKINGEMEIPFFIIIPVATATLFFIVPPIINHFPLTNRTSQTKLTQADDTSQTELTQADNIYYFAYTPDSSPIGYEDRGVFRGYCRSLFNFLEAESNNSESPLSGYKFEQIDITYNSRFERKAFIKDHEGKTYEVPKDSLTIECGASTITKDRKDKISIYGGEFSTPFAKTGAKLLINKAEILKKLEKKERKLISEDKLQESKRIFNQVELTDEQKEYILTKFLSSQIWELEYPLLNNLPLLNEKILVIDKTTTKSLISHIYPGSNISEEFKDRAEVIDTLQNKEYLIYASDEILLRDMLVSTLKDDKDNYFIGPGYLLSHENYGVVVYDTQNNKVILTEINKWIKDEEQGGKLRRI